MTDLPYELDGPRRRIFMEAILSVAVYRGWELYAVHVRSNHVHIVAEISTVAKTAIRDFKEPTEAGR